MKEKRGTRILKERKAFQLAISTLVIITLALLVLLALSLAFTGGFKKFMMNLKGYSVGDIDILSKICQSQCDLRNKYDFCCEQKQLGKEKITCSDSRLYVVCDINCKDVC